VTELETTVCLAVSSVCYKSSRLLLLNPKLSAGILSLEFQKESLGRDMGFGIVLPKYQTQRVLEICRCSLYCFADCHWRNESSSLNINESIYEE
jgi:hypothetical protein